MMKVNSYKIKIFFLSFLFSITSNVIFTQKYSDFLYNQMPKRFELSDRLNYFKTMKCDSIVGSFCSSKTFNHITDKNKLTNKNGIGLEYLGNEALSDSVFFHGFLCVGLVKIIEDSRIMKIIDYDKGPLDRVEYEYDIYGSLIFETHYFSGEKFIEREWENGKLIYQFITPLLNGKFESFIIKDGCFTYYSMVIRNDISFLTKKYSFSGIEINSFKISYKEKGCKETIEVDYYPGFIMSRSEYITDCVFEIKSYESNYNLMKKIISSGNYVYPSNDVTYKKTNRKKIGEWRYFDINNIVKKIDVFDENGKLIDCKGECN